MKYRGEPKEAVNYVASLAPIPNALSGAIESSTIQRPTLSRSVSRSTSHRGGDDFMNEPMAANEGMGGFGSW